MIPEQIVRRLTPEEIEEGGPRNLWVIALVMELWIASIVLYVPGMP